MDKFYDELIQKIKKEDILKDEPMEKHTSIKIGGPADYFINARSIDDLKYIIEKCKNNNINYFIIGNGTNLLVKDKGIRGAVIKLQMNDINLEDDKITAYAGASLISLCRFAKENEITGFENLSGIPGTIGGAVRMNAGAYGTEIKDVLICSKVLINGEIKEFDNKSHDFKYRESIFSKNDAIILESSFKAQKGNQKMIETIMNDVLEKRKNTQPLDKPNSGSTFKRGEDFITAKLIDEAGLKGYKIGGAQISNKHSGFIVNENNATAQDVIKLIKYTKDVIKEKFGKDIFEEIIIIGE